MTYDRSDLIVKIADIVDFEPEKFDMTTLDCGSAACIAGHIGRIAGDKYYDDTTESHLDWTDRRAAMIGLDRWAGDYVFNRQPMINLPNSEISEFLRNLAKEVAEMEDGEVLEYKDAVRIVSEITEKSSSR